MTDIEVQQRKYELGDAILKPTFTWTSPFALHVVFPNGQEDDISLQAVRVAGKPIKCLFRGLFYRDSSASAVVSGCIEDHTVTITIVSKELWGKTAFEVNDGLVEELENPYANTEANSSWGTVKLPAPPSNKTSVYVDVTLKFAFDWSLRDECGSEEAARAYVRSVAEHGSLYLENFSPETKIFLNFLDEIQFVDETLKPTAVDLRKLSKSSSPRLLHLSFSALQMTQTNWWAFLMAYLEKPANLKRVLV